ncbi:hypothetical protein A7U43_28420 (plasmid) [Mycobacterium adipatum]|uniref:Uncharacterized protein n=1 Tax=Mycobacterium adipatum TaxID=1682113 RepID=A0A172UWT3_9MYCO|nr:hypothetical protein [Mycobacterium adipatum]ANE83440.1 hypothetical protein A7U43_28420 [Mycobacterium adipatum]
MCRAVLDGGRRCPCTRGDRRRAYQRMRYAARQAAAAAGAPDPAPRDTDGAEQADSITLQDRRSTTAAAIDSALVALRDPDRSSDPDVHEAYLNAVLDHGAVVRDVAGQRIENTYAERGLDDASVGAEATAVAAELEQIEARWRETKSGSSAYLTADGTSFTAEGATALDEARNAYAAAKMAVYRRAGDRSKEINEQRAQIAREIYYDELSRERSFGGPAAEAFVPSNTAKMTRADRAMFSATAALYPDDMVEHANNLGDMLAKRSKARAHYTAGARQLSRRTRTEVFDLRDAMEYGRFRFNHFIDSPADMARGAGSIRDRYSAENAFVPRTPDNERKVGELVAQYNDSRRQHATIEYATAIPKDGGEPYEVMYVKGPRKRVTTEVTGISAELTFSDASSMTHELGHRMEDRNPEISTATKAFLRRRTAGLAPERYARSEMTVADGFADRYMGKDYAGTHHTELFSCGMEAVAHGRFGGLVGRPQVFLPAPGGLSIADRAQRPKPDTEHLALVLGLLAAANKQIG